MSNANDPRADEILREQSQLASERSNFDSQWREIAERVRPEQNLFQSERSPGLKLNDKIFDSTAQLALPKYSAACQSMIAPATQKWHGLDIDDEELNDCTDTKRWCEALTNLLFRLRYTPRANFQGQFGEVVMDQGAFGTGILFTDELMPKWTLQGSSGGGFRYKSLPLSECFMAEDAYGTINRLHRRFQLTGDQAVGLLKSLGANPDSLPASIKRAAELHTTDKFWFVHAVKPNPDRKGTPLHWRGMAYWSCYVCEEGRSIVSEGGFRVFPFAVARAETAPREVYGRGPAMKVLQTIKGLNEMKKTVLRAAHMVTSPALLLADDGALGVNLRPNALNYGALDGNGNALVKPLLTGGKVEIGMEMMNAEREAINDAFYVTLFRILVDEPQITATEAMLRAQEKGQLLAPPMGGMQSSLCGPTIEREIDILTAAGKLPPMPEKLQEYFDAGGEWKVRYQAPLNLAQRAGEGIGILNTIQGIAPIAQIDPSVMKVIKTKETVRHLWELNGGPMKLLNSEEEMAAIEDSDGQAAAAQQLLAAAPVAASSAKDFAQAQALAAAAPNQAAPAVLELAA